MFNFLVKFNCFVLLAKLCFIVNTSDTNEIRDRPRLFGNTYTSTVTKSQTVTLMVPSSCVQVDATLPPCRNVRVLRFPKLPTITFNYPYNREVVSLKKPESETQTTALGWGEYFGLYAPTEIVTTTDFVTSTVEDPSVVVTFAVKGCRPLQPPLDLNRCPQENPPTISLQDAIQTSTVAPPDVPTETLLPTKTMSVVSSPSTAYGSISDLTEDRDNSNLLEPSLQELSENGASQSTESLPE